jgi:hypothetical protein
VAVGNELLRFSKQRTDEQHEWLAAGHALSGLSSVVQGHSRSFSPHLCPGEAISGYSHRSLCAFYSNLYRAHLRYRCRGLAVAPRSPSMPNATESTFRSKAAYLAAEAKRLWSC